MTKKAAPGFHATPPAAQDYWRRPRATYLLLGNLYAVSPLATCPPALAERARADGAPFPVPAAWSDDGRHYYIPGSGWRSKLRGALTQMQREASRERGVLMSLHDAQYNRLGGVKQSGEETEPAMDEVAVLRARNPLISLFGSSTPWLTGKAMVGSIITAKPNIPLVVHETVRAAMLRRDPEMIEFLDPQSAADIAAARSAVSNSQAAKAEIKELKKTLKGATQDERATINARIATLEGATVVSEQNLQPGYCAIPAGADLSNRIVLDKVTTLELGAMLCAIERFAQMPMLGGHLAHGCGQVGGKWTITESGREVGAIAITDIAMCAVDGEALVAAMAEYKAFLASAELNIKAPAAKPGKAEVDA